MAAVCREFNISRKTGHKLLQRYRDSGLHGLTDRSRRPYRQANQLPMQIERLIVRLKKDYPNWGAPKIQERLRRLYPDIHCPAVSTVHAVLDRNGLVKRWTRRRNRAAGTPLSHTRQPNELWCADYKGEFMLADRRYCYPLTITDYASRYLIACEALHTTKEVYAFAVFEHAFKDFGVPAAIRTDNGVPFASPNALFNLSKLSVWWLRLGISVERIKPGNPQQNGRHERMHLTLKLETTKPAGANVLEQQGKFDDFIKVFNTERPHQALAMAVPADHYRPSPRQYQGLHDIDYPFHDKAVTVTTCGRICFNRQKINLSQVFAGQTVGIKQTDDKIWLVSFMDYDLGYFDDETCRLEPLQNPFGPKVLPMSPV
ncbi:integrase [Phyllobacterium phragmitis]|uniref:Integrase n=2 Tax=Phyllobacterium phragmitis TaxID=2670329 RepID=A0A2S9IIM9_9HYPH|nr:integrase [Phyllobacterium phragmitis]